MRDEQWIRQSGKGFHVINCWLYCRTSFSFGHLDRFSQLIWNSVGALCTGCCRGFLLGEELDGRWAAKVWCLRNQLISCKGIKWIAHAATSTKRWEDLFHFQLSGGTRRRLHWRDLNCVVLNTWKLELGGIQKMNKTKNLNYPTVTTHKIMVLVWCHWNKATVGVSSFGDGDLKEASPVSMSRKDNGFVVMAL